MTRRTLALLAALIAACALLVGCGGSHHRGNLQASLTPSLAGDAASPTVGEVFSTSNGTWTNSPTGFAYQWLQCDTAGGNCTSITGATSSTYTVASGDVGHTIRSQVTASNASGSGSQQSSATGVVVTGGGTGTPANSAVPSISGTAQPGNVLTATTGTWTNNPTTYTYQWYEEKTPLSGATSATYTVSPSDVDHTLDVAVTASNGSGTSTAAGSNSTGVVNQACTKVDSTAATIISDMQNTANGGQVICAAPGTYTISGLSVNQSSMTTLEAQPGATQPTLTGGISLAGANLRIEGFALAEGFYTAGANHLKIVGNYFHDCTACGSLLFINNAADIGDFTISHNRMINVKQADAFNDGYGVYGCQGNPTNIKILYNTFQNMNQHPDETTCSGMTIIGNEIDHAYYDSNTADQHVDCIEIWGGASTIDIEDNRCEDTTGANLTQGMLLSGDTSNGKLINNLIVNINDQCVDDTPNGTSPNSFKNWTVKNNTVDDCGHAFGGGGIGGGYGMQMTGPNSTGNIFQFNVFSSWGTNGSSTQFSPEDHNNCTSCSSMPGQPGTGDTKLTPVYVDHHNWQTSNLPAGWGYQPARVGYQANLP